MNAKVTGFLLFLLPAGFLISGAYLGSRAVLINGLLKLWLEQAKKVNRELDVEPYRLDFQKLSIRDLILLREYTTKVMAGIDDRELAPLQHKILAAKILDKMEKAPLDGIIFEG
jgi:hypothetical protein